MTRRRSAQLPRSFAEQQSDADPPILVARREVMLVGCVQKAALEHHHSVLAVRDDDRRCTRNEGVQVDVGFSLAVVRTQVKPRRRLFQVDNHAAGAGVLVGGVGDDPEVQVQECIVDMQLDAFAA
eukprot:CAMPEP_0183593126 /NCGR_PEP_ID=MMETSP0371-20130417/169231_1 /TAXON_ID=268820 /ORGANISM="Peridinium aciculiferum, Strain PAER-2" /LENGTH=124 /DNA_ID=CAMNT_0025804709 /DNA_START=222 /DNA_END=593 /DNA_ORIENTATION=-